jgi:hypothetical protein
MENLGILFDHLVYFTAIGNIIWPLGIFCGNLVYFSAFWNFGPRKIWRPWFTQQGVNVTLPVLQYEHLSANLSQDCQIFLIAYHNIPKREQKIMAINVPTGNKIHQRVSFQGLAEIFPNWNFRNQICHLAILI